MKLPLLCLSVFLASAVCAPQYESTELETNITVASKMDNKEIVSNFLAAFEAPSKDYKIRSTAFASMFLRSVDKDCIVKEVEKNDLVEAINLLGTKKGGEKSLLETVMVLGFIAHTCSSKSDVHLSYAFDILMSHHGLLKAYIDEPELKEYADMLACANNYAVKHDILDPKVYTFNYELNDEQEESCMEWTEQASMIISEAKLATREKFSRACAIKVVDKINNFVLKYVLLIQVDMTVEQKQQERINFIEDHRRITDDVLQCAAKKTNKPSEIYSKLKKFL